MLHHYIQKGHSISDLLGLNVHEKAFYKASMVIDQEERGNLMRMIPSILMKGG